VIGVFGHEAGSNVGLVVFHAFTTRCEKLGAASALNPRFHAVSALANTRKPSGFIWNEWMYGARFRVVMRFRLWRYHFFATILCAEAAALVYDDAARRLHGEYAGLNFPD
jgi:hypothetical protein